MAGVRVLEQMMQVGQRLLVVEDRVLGPGAAAAVNNTMAPPPPSSSSSTASYRPGAIGLDADGNVLIEPLAGRAVLVAGRDMVRELHHISLRLNLTERIMASCPCLLPPATCRPVKE
jgi:hypothetical protein